MSAEHVPGQSVADGVCCPRCECPEVLLVGKDEREVEIWDRKRRQKVRWQITRRRRQCQNDRCEAVFQTIERIEL